MREHDLRDVARRLRRDATPAEKRLWRVIRGDALGVTFRRQHAIPPYIADFASIEAMRVVELDGGTHAERDDPARDAALADAGWRVLRCWNNEVMGNLEGVLQRIAEAVEARKNLGR